MITISHIHYHICETTQKHASLKKDQLPGQVRGTALQVWSLLIKSARLGAQERGQPNAMAKELLGTGLQVGPVFLRW